MTIANAITPPPIVANKHLLHDSQFLAAGLPRDTFGGILDEQARRFEPVIDSCLKDCAEIDANPQGQLTTKGKADQIRERQAKAKDDLVRINSEVLRELTAIRAGIRPRTDLRKDSERSMPEVTRLLIEAQHREFRDFLRSMPEDRRVLFLTLAVGTAEDFARGGVGEDAAESLEAARQALMAYEWASPLLRETLVKRAVFTDLRDRVLRLLDPESFEKREAFETALNLFTVNLDRAIKQSRGGGPGKWMADQGVASAIEV